MLDYNEKNYYEPGGEELEQEYQRELAREEECERRYDFDRDRDFMCM